PEPAVMAAAVEAGVTRLFRVGGAHAVAALAYGTKTIPRVDKIVGPGNRYVATAKAIVAGDCAIDFYAGPTEIVIVAGAGRAACVGDFSAQAAGDYATGSNHVLPTGGAARFRGGLNAADFVRVMAVQRVTRPGLARLADTILPLARAEGLQAHAESVELRLK